jgi:uncharacterized membrane protein (Fun14 family)
MLAAGYAITKVTKIAAVIVGLFVIGLAYLSYRDWIDVKWTKIENATRSALTDVTIQVPHTLAVVMGTYDAGVLQISAYHKSHHLRSLS